MIKLEPFVDDFKNRFLVFDDLEKSNAPVEKVLRYINSFVEHQNTKVIIIANDDEIESLEQFESNHNSSTK